MSHPDPLTRLAWAYSADVPGPAKAVLVYLAFRDGESCNPSVRTISKDTGYSRNTVKAAIKLLVDACLIETQERYSNNRRLSDLYVLDYMHMRTGSARTHMAGVGQELTQGGSGADPGVGQEMATEHEEEHESERGSDTEVSDQSVSVRTSLRVVDTSDRAFRRDGEIPGKGEAKASPGGPGDQADDRLPDPWGDMPDTMKAWGYR